MSPERQSGASHKGERLTEKFRDKRRRHNYVSAYNRRFLAQQLRSLRGELSQAEFGQLIGKLQSVVSRLEDPNYGKFTLQTLHEVAAKLDRAVIVRIVDFKTFLKLTEDMTESAMCPPGYDETDFDAFETVSFDGVSADSDVSKLPPVSPSHDWINPIREPTGDQWQRVPELT